MTSQTLARVTETLTKDGVTWRILDVSTPGPCALVPWCEGSCEDLEPGELGTDHARNVATALVDGVPVVEIAVCQWVANPEIGVRDSGTLFALNRDAPPTVGIFTYGARHYGTFLENPWGRVLREALRLVGHDPFADALDIATCLAQEIDEQRQAAAPKMEVKR